MATDDVDSMMKHLPGIQARKAEAKRKREQEKLEAAKRWSSARRAAIFRDGSLAVYRNGEQVK